ncbi:hypothetical protein [uncultured Ottowia sp.]|uniref:hypothetical protein n=1 Tax=uncultured Ottowia sp. TaxID=543067 RepID=UPI0025946D15|nr:hypothetical protein [uncultured Ottowia sp.]
MAGAAQETGHCTSGRFFILADHFQRRESAPVQAIQKGGIKAAKLPRSNVSARKQKKTGKWNEAI